MPRVYAVDRMNEIREELDKKLHVLFGEVSFVIGEQAAWLFGSTLGGAKVLSRLAGNGGKYANSPVNDIEQDLVNFGVALGQNNGQVSDEIFDVLVPHYTSKELVILIAFAGQLTAANLFYNVFELTADDADS